MVTLKIIKFSLESIGTNSTFVRDNRGMKNSHFDKKSMYVHQTSITHPFVFDSNLISHSSNRLVLSLGNSIREIMSRSNKVLASSWTIDI